VAAALARRYGAALRELHDRLDPATCPFDGRLDVRLDAAARRVAEGLVHAADFEPEHAERTPAEVLDLLRRTRPADEDDLVVTHGDWCFPNVLFDDDGDRPAWWGMVDLAGLGVACRWYDLGIGSRSTAHNLGEAAVPAFFEGYGIEPDDERVEYSVLLDELQ
jgi:aminoglycoside phosphotransferase